jgi:hypothetical protein
LIELYSPTPRLKSFYAMVADCSLGWDGHHPIRMLST